MKGTNIIGKIYLISTLKMAGFCRRPNSESCKKGRHKVKQSNFSDEFILSLIVLNEQLWHAWKLIDPCPSQCLNINVLIDLTTLLSHQFHLIPRSQVYSLTLTYQFESFESYNMLLLGGRPIRSLRPPTHPLKKCCLQMVWGYHSMTIPFWRGVLAGWLGRC